MNDEQPKETTTLDRLYLEWSQFTEARTARELDMAMLIRRLCSKMSYWPMGTPENNTKRESADKLVGQAVDYLKRQGLQGSILRQEKP